MQHDRWAGGTERRGKRTQIWECERIDADRTVAGGELQQAKLGPIGAFAHEFRVEPDRGLAQEVAEKVLQARSGGDDFCVRRHGSTMQEFDLPRGTKSA